LSALQNLVFHRRHEEIEAINPHVILHQLDPSDPMPSTDLPGPLFAVEEEEEVLCTPR